MNELADFDRLVGLIYQAALEPESWRDALTELAAVVEADGWHLLGWSMEQKVDLLGVLPDVPPAAGILASYNAHYGAIDPRRALSEQYGPGAVMCCHRHFSERFVSGSEFFQDFLLPLDLRYSMGGSVRRNLSVDYQIGLTRGRKGGAFMADEETLLRRLMPHFDRALHLMERAQTLAMAAEIATTGLDATPLAVIGLDAAGRPRHCNRRGEQLLKSGEVLCLRDGVIICPAQDQQSRFAEAMEASAATGRSANMLLRHRQRPDERYSVTFICPPEGGVFGHTHPSVTLLCLVAPVERRRIATTRQLMALFALSPAEARLARALADGESLDEYALGVGLKVTTVKSQLRSIFSKTGTDRQTALVRLILGIPAIREVERPSGSR